MAIVEQCGKYYSSLKDSNKMIRRKALEEMLEIIGTCENSTSKDFEHILSQCDQSLILLLSDDSEINRYKAARLLNVLIVEDAVKNNLVSCLVPALVHRIGGTVVVEESEENRLEFLCLLESVIRFNTVKMQPLLDDIIKILSKSLDDKYPEVILKSCCIIELISKLFKEKFPMFSNIFVKPLLKNINQKLKIRIKVIQTLGCIFLSGDCQEFIETSNVLMNCIYDNPQVRMEIVKLGYSLASKMADRYSYWFKILPLLIFGLWDDDPEIKSTAETMWNQVGHQFEVENQSEDLKSMVVDIKSSYESYNCGCCTLIKRNFYHMLFDIEKKNVDWLSNVRLLAVKLLSVCIIGLESDCIQYSDKILELILSSASDQECRVAAHALKCAELLGKHLPPTLYIRILKPFLWTEKDEPYLILSALLSTTDENSVKEHLELFFDLLSFKNLEENMSYERKVVLLKIHKILFKHYFPGNSNFFPFFTLFFLTNSTDQEEELQNVMQVVYTNYCMNSADEFIFKYANSFISIMQEIETPWTEGSPMLMAFIVLSEFQGLEYHLDALSDILKLKNETSSDAVVYHKILQSLENILKRLKCSESFDLLQSWSVYIITEHINKHLVWKAGKAAQSLRMAALSYLNSVVMMVGASKYNIYSALQIPMKLVPELITDELPETRILSCKLIELIINYHKDTISPDIFLSLIMSLSKRLDDNNTKVRYRAAEVLSIITIDIPYASDFHDKIISLVKEIALFTAEEDSEMLYTLSVTLQNIGKKYHQEIQIGMNDLKMKGLHLKSLDSLKNLNIE